MVDRVWRAMTKILHCAWNQACTPEWMPDAVAILLPFVAVALIGTLLGGLLAWLLSEGTDDD